MRHFMHSKPCFTNFTLCTRNFKRMKAIVFFQNQIWCIDMTKVDNLANDNTGVKTSLIRQDLFNTTVGTKGIKTNESEKNVLQVSNISFKKTRTSKVLVERGTKIAGECKNVCSAEVSQFHSTMTETKSRFTECTTWYLKTVPYRYLEDQGYKFFQKMSQPTTNLKSRKKNPDRLVTKECWRFRLFVHYR